MSRRVLSRLVSLGWVVVLGAGCFDPLPTAMDAAPDVVTPPTDVAQDTPDTATPEDRTSPPDLGTPDTPDVAIAPDVQTDDVPIVPPMDAGEVDGGTTDTGPEDIGDAGMDVRDVGFDIPTVDIPITNMPVLPAAGRSSAVAVTSDDRVVVSANRTTGSVSIFALVPGQFAQVARLEEVSTGSGSEPWSVAVSPDNNTAFAVLRRDAQLVRINNLRGGATVATTRVNVGSEPMGLALSPLGRFAWVTNYAEGTVSVVDTNTLRVTATVDLNATLAGAGYLAPDQPVRPGLAHPRAIVITNDGDTDETDEVAYVTEYFAQRRPSGLPTGNERFDQSHLGVVYRIPLDTRTPTVVTLSHVTDMGFRDANNTVAGCYPNQLSALAVASNRLYVTATCASPRGPSGDAPPTPIMTDAGPRDATVDAVVDTGVRDVPVDVGDVPRDVVGDVGDSGPPPLPALPQARQNLRTVQTPALFVVDLAMNPPVETTAQRVLLNSRFQTLYDARRTPDDATRRMPLTPVDIAFTPAANGSTNASLIAWVLSSGSDALFRVRFNTNGTLAEVAAPAPAPLYVDLAAGVLPGRLPYGLALSGLTANNAVVVHEHSRNVNVVRLDTQVVTAGTELSAMTLTASAQAVLDGRRSFVSGTGRWSLGGQGWSSCESCHPGGTSDGVTWYTARGPRQTPSLEDAIDVSGAPRLFGWSATHDEVADQESEVRGLARGVRAILHRNDNGAMPAAITDADRIIYDGTTVTAPQRTTAERHDGLNGSVDTIANSTSTGTVRSANPFWSQIGQYLRSLRPLRRPVGLSEADITAGRALFVTGQCAGCHGGPRWSIATRFYAPGGTITSATGLLTTQRWTRPAGMPTEVVPSATLAFRVNATDARNDQITCGLRTVGTWATGAGVAPTGVVLAEVRSDMSTASQGQTGFNIPSLMGVGQSAPYFHAGNARSLEEAFSTTFARHHQSYAGTTFLAGTNATAVRQLVAFLLSIDSRTDPVDVPATVPGSTAFAPDLCRQYRAP